MNLADRCGRIDGDHFREFYRLWSAGAGYCNPKGVLRRLITSVKNRFIRILLSIWPGALGGLLEQAQIFVLEGYLIYIDTSYGQVSFNLK